jgi:hypothetical protein
MPRTAMEDWRHRADEPHKCSVGCRPDIVQNVALRSQCSLGRTSGFFCCLWTEKRPASSRRKVCLSVTSMRSNSRMMDGMHRQACSTGTFCQKFWVREFLVLPASGPSLCTATCVQCKSQQFQVRLSQRPAPEAHPHAHLENSGGSCAHLAKEAQPRRRLERDRHVCPVPEDRFLLDSNLATRMLNYVPLSCWSHAETSRACQVTRREAIKANAGVDSRTNVLTHSTGHWKTSHIVLITSPDCFQYYEVMTFRVAQHLGHLGSVPCDGSSGCNGKAILSSSIGIVGLAVAPVARGAPVAS